MTIREVCSLQILLSGTRNCCPTASLSPVGMALAVHSLLVDGVWDYVPQVIRSEQVTVLM